MRKMMSRSAKIFFLMKTKVAPLSILCRTHRVPNYGDLLLTILWTSQFSRFRGPGGSILCASWRRTLRWLCFARKSVMRNKVFPESKLKTIKNLIIIVDLAFVLDTTTTKTKPFFNVFQKIGPGNPWKRSAANFLLIHKFSAHFLGYGPMSDNFSILF